MIKSQTVHGLYIKRAFIFMPASDRKLAAFRAERPRYFLAVTFADNRREFTYPVFNDDLDDNLAVLLDALHIELSQDVEANKPARILIATAHRINAVIRSPKYRFRPLTFTVKVSADTDTIFIPDQRPKLKIEIRPEQRQVNAVNFVQSQPDLFDARPEFDLMVRADSSAVGHRNDWPLMLKRPTLDALGVSIRIGQGGAVYLVQSATGELDPNIERYDEATQEEIAKAAYLKILNGWDVIKNGPSGVMNTVTDTEEVAEEYTKEERIL